MCGIVAAISDKDVTPFLLSGLSCLEYRGYDSAGIGVIHEQLYCIRSHGRVEKLSKIVGENKIVGKVGIAHTRWATHGAPSENNAHPQVSGDIAVVHNGIIENYENLKEELIKNGFEFKSDTDTEVIAHLINHNRNSANLSLREAVQNTVKSLEGSFAICVISKNHVDEIITARRGSPLLIGVAEKATYCASDASALVSETTKVVYLENGDVASLSTQSYEIFDANGKRVERSIQTSHISAKAVDLENYQHFMQKEIFEQPAAILNTLEMALGGSSLTTNLFGANAESIFKSIKSITILGCGTSYHAGLTARYWIEDLAGIPCNVEISSEYRYRNSPRNKDDLVIVTSQSGETADTIAALQYALNKTGNTKYSLAICNVPESSLVRLSGLKFLTRAGPEIGVASTKAFTTQLVSFFLLAVTLAKVKGKLDAQNEKKYFNLLQKLPSLISETFKLEEKIKEWAGIFSSKSNCIFLGRGMHYPIALEGALKLKEISYIHAEGYPAGELKHGPLALIDNNTPVVVVAPNNTLLEKLKSNMKEVSARGGQLYVFADSKSIIREEKGINVISMPDDSSFVSPIVHTVPLQLLAYHTASVKGTDIDKPRNLAKSVTVE